MDRNFPRITVVTPSYNQARFLEATMESIHGSGYPNLEHIVMDGGSTDGSVEIIRRYEDRLAFWKSEPDGGQAAAIASGFELSTGEILCWLNSDDLFLPSTLFEVAEVFTSNPTYQFIYGNAEWIDDAGKYIKPKLEHRFSRFVFLWDHNFIPQPSSFWRRSIYFDVGGVDQSFFLAMDADLWARFSERTRPVHIRRVWSRMRFYPEQKMIKYKDQNAAELEHVRARLGLPADRPGDALRRMSARVVRVALKVAAGGYTWSELSAHAKSAVRGQTWAQWRQERL